MYPALSSPTPGTADEVVALCSLQTFLILSDMGQNQLSKACGFWRFFPVRHFFLNQARGGNLQGYHAKAYIDVHLHFDFQYFLASRSRVRTVLYLQKSICISLRAMGQALSIVYQNTKTSSLPTRPKRPNPSNLSALLKPRPSRPRKAPCNTLNLLLHSSTFSLLLHRPLHKILQVSASCSTTNSLSSSPITLLHVTSYDSYHIPLANSTASILSFSSAFTLFPMSSATISRSPLSLSYSQIRESVFLTLATAMCPKISRRSFDREDRGLEHEVQIPRLLVSRDRGT
ncbi:hypothetical protein GQ43DRAFT_80919 [Delitschia confertaspora ATCC 74209]|uniref:Uncharacterized protein n=1 Tax=Delitschia confertaspora ATCC 74209 TaxID=1513339 RepID=A0A9P4MP58_9PLEO|nr:hypothetical protein GQ43DRAFT_80919 [Delitschia confertaspora ATCC 74209]